MTVTVLGIVVFLQPAIKVLAPVLIMALQLFLESNDVLPVSTTICANEEQYPNASFPIEDTDAGMVIEVMQAPKNAELPMEVTVFGIVIKANL